MHLEAARGWFELGNMHEAGEELARITGLRRAEPDVQKVRLQIALRSRDWSGAFALAQGLIQASPRDGQIYLWRSQAVRHLSDDGLSRALSLLLEVANDFPDEPAIPFQLACYNCQLDQASTAQCWLAIAFECALRNGTAKKWKSTALDEGDLAPLRKKMGEAVGLWL